MPEVSLKTLQLQILQLSIYIYFPKALIRRKLLFN
jgi:hypothetical protein